MSNTTENIKAIIDDYESMDLECNPIFAPTNKDVIELIDLYWTNRFRDGDYDSANFKKAFYNIVINPTEVAAKMIDLDTKDVIVVAEDGQSYYPSWFFGKELKIWMKSKKNQDGQTFGQLLNQMVYQFPKYGHLIVKKAKDTVHIVPIQNIYCDPEAKNFMSSDVIVEKHEYTAEQLRKQNGWKNVEEVVGKYEEGEMITVYEVLENIGEGDNYTIMADRVDEDKPLYTGKIKKGELYKELKWEDIPGRALGRGQVEKLFEAQIAKNQNEHLLRRGYRWTSKKLWQTRDDNIAKNLITELEDGDVLTVNSEITPISMEERNLGAISLGDQKWDKNIASLTFSFEPMSGQRPAGGTPLGTTVLQTRMAGQYYDLKREDLGMFIKDILFDWVIPEFKKQKRSIHNLMLGEFDEDELSKLKDLVLVTKNNDALINSVKKNGKVPNMKEMEILKAITKEKMKSQKDIKIPAKFYDNLKYKIDIVITNEQVDMTSRLTTLQTVLQIIGSNPTILKDPRTRKIFYKLLDLSGISPTDFREEEPDLAQVAGQNTAQVGGSIAKATPTASPAHATVPTTL